MNDLLSRMTIEEKAHQLASFFPNANVRLGIPHMQAGEALHGICLPLATSFPQAIALASTWDPEIIEEAVSIAQKLDVAVVVLGGNEVTCKENESKSFLILGILG